MSDRRRPEPTDDGEVDADATEESPEPRRARRHGRRGRRSSAPPPPNAWSIDGDSEEEAPVAEDLPEEDEPGILHRTKRPVFYRARDAWWFELVVAAMVLVVVLVGLFAYTQNWPPMYVVESSSMQHGTDDHVGLINTGDLVLAQQVPTDSIVPYVVAMQTGYTTYGEYGDVLLYHAYGDTGPAPIIHRALLYLQYNGNGSYNAPDLAGLRCGHAADAVYLSATPTGCGYLGLRGTLELFGIGWQSVSVNVTLGDVGQHSGFVTMGDNNINPGTRTGDQDEPGLSSLVEPGWVVGVARGMVPWVGSLKLLLGGNATEVPSQSWAFLGLSIAGVFLIGALIHFGLRAEGVEDERRKALEEEEAAEAETRPSRFGGIRGWFSRSKDDDEEVDDSDEPPTPSRKKGRRGKGGHAAASGGRPRPAVRRHETDPEYSERPPGGDAEDL